MAGTLLNKYLSPKIYSVINNYCDHVLFEGIVSEKPINRAKLIKLERRGVKSNVLDKNKAKHCLLPLNIRMHKWVF